MIQNEKADPDFFNDLYLFYRKYIAHYKFGSKSKPAKHIKKLSRHLMALKSGRLDKHLAVSMPPRHSKSTMITVAYPLWLIFQNPNLNILVVSNTKELAEKFGIEIREFIIRHGAKFNVYLSNVKHSSTHIKICDEDGNLYNGSIRLTGASGSITGQDADYIIIDDPYKGEEEEFTPSALLKKINWFKRVIIQRIEPHTRLLILHTRWHSLDLIGYIKSKASKLAHKFKFITYPVLDKLGNVLWPEQYSKQDIQEKLEALKERLFSAIYMQKPLDETSDFFDITKLQYTSLQPDERIIETIRVWDIQSSDSLKADFTVGSKMVLTNKGRIGVTNIIRGQFGDNTKKKIQDTAKLDGFNVKILIETGIAAAGHHLFQEWKTQLLGYRVIQSKPIKSKPDRATPLKFGILDEVFFLDLHDDVQIDTVNGELQSFPEGQHDDIVDTFAYGYIYLHRPRRAKIFV